MADPVTAVEVVTKQYTNVAGYVSQPPAVLTRLKALVGMTDPLPAGRFGQPPLLLSEEWVKKGVAVAILSAVSAKSVLLFGLVLVVTAVFLANAALATVRTRRRELGGLLAGVAGAALSALLITVLGLDLPLTRVALVPLVAVALAVLAGLAPATLAGRGQPLDVVLPTRTTRRRRLVARRRRRRSPATLGRLAVRNLGRHRGRTLTAALTLALGVAALTAIIAITAAFNDAIVGSLLGGYVTTEVRGVDYLAVALTLALAGLSVADVLLLHVRERAPELVTLHATGWADRDLVRLTLLEALGVGAAGALPGAAVGLTLGVLIGAPLPPTLLGAATAALVGLAITLTAAALPAHRVTRTTIAAALADE